MYRELNTKWMHYAECSQKGFIVAKKYLVLVSLDEYYNAKNLKDAQICMIPKRYLTAANFF